MTKASRSRSSSELKKLYTRRNVLTASIARQATASNRNQTRYRQNCDELAEINRQLDSLKSNRVTMSEHAILRYLQRAQGVDLDAVCNAVVTPELIAQVQALGDGKYPIGNGLRVQVVNKMIVTVVDW